MKLSRLIFKGTETDPYAPSAVASLIDEAAYFVGEYRNRVQEAYRERYLGRASDGSEFSWAYRFLYRPGNLWTRLTSAGYLMGPIPVNAMAISGFILLALTQDTQKSVMAVVEPLAASADKKSGIIVEKSDDLQTGAKIYESIPQPALTQLLTTIDPVPENFTGEGQYRVKEENVPILLGLPTSLPKDQVALNHVQSLTKTDLELPKTLNKPPALAPEISTLLPLQGGETLAAIPEYCPPTENFIRFYRQRIDAVDSMIFCLEGKVINSEINNLRYQGYPDDTPVSMNYTFSYNDNTYSFNAPNVPGILSGPVDITTSYEE